jgi:ribosomal protein S27E
LDIGSPQRAYRAACPGCGAPVEFRSAQSTHAVCGYCQSTVVRTGDVLARVGKMAELFDDFSPLQLQASGIYQSKKFTLIGRLQYKYGAGTWTEWIALFDDDAQSTGYLSEDNGAFVFTQPFALARSVPAAAQMRVGATTAIDGKAFSVASIQSVALMSAQGELPRPPTLGQAFDIVELRSADGEVLSIDYCAVATGGAPSLSRGRAVLLDDLKLTGLRDASSKDEKGRQFACPNCGAQVAVTLATSKSITCKSCNSIIDLQSGTGAELRYAIQDEPVALLIPLGTTGQLQGVQWQVVGFQHRMGNEPGDDEQFGWSEYLLYNQKRGFTFLVDAEDGWSLVKPTTGAPIYKAGSQSAQYMSANYKLQSSYSAETNYVAGEFYWQVVRGQKTANIDFANGSAMLSREQTPSEVTWSSGSKLNGAIVAAAFRLDGSKELFKRNDAQPLSAASGMSITTIIIVVIVMVILVAMFSRCSSCNPNVENCSSSSGSRTSGGSFGGSSGGGGHK